MKPAVYFIQAGVDGPIKIGVATDVKARRAELQVGCPTPLRILAVAPKLNERSLHTQLAPLRVRGEWFRPERALLEIVATLPPFPAQPERVRSLGGSVILRLNPALAQEVERLRVDIERATGTPTTFAAVARAALIAGLAIYEARRRKGWK